MPLSPPGSSETRCDLKQPYLAVANVVQSSYEVDNHRSPDVHLKQVLLPIELELPCLDGQSAVRWLDHERLVEFLVQLHS